VPQANKIQSFQGKVVVQLGKAPDPAQLLLTSNTVYLNGVCESKINAPKVWTHLVQAYSRTIFDDLSKLIDTEESPKIWIRHGVTDGSQSFFTEWEPQVLVSVRSKPSTTPDAPHGFAITIVTSDLLYLMNKEERVVSRKGKINDIISSIALANGFEKLAIEPTQGDYALVQSFETDFDFVVDRLLPAAGNKEGASQFLFFARGAFFHFHTINYQLSGLYTFDYGASSNTLTNVTLTNRTNTNDRKPSSGVKLVAFDPLTGKTTAWETRSDSELSLANTLPKVKGTVYSQKHVGQNQLTALYSESQSQYVDAKDDLHDVTFLVDNFPFIGVGDVVNGQFVTGQGDPWSGFYFVKYVKHTIENSRIISLYSLTRGEFVSDNPNVTGKQLNEGELAASNLTSSTTGNFPGSSGGTVVEVNNPGSLLIPPPSS